VSSLHLIDLVREVWVFVSIRREERGPPASSRSAAGAHAGGEVLPDAVGDQELCVLGPSVKALAEADLLVTERLAGGRGGALLVGRAVADVAVEDDQGGTPLRRAEDRERVLDAIEVVCVAHAEDVPAVPQEAGGDVLREGEARLPFDRDVVVVVDPAEVV